MMKNKWLGMILLLAMVGCGPSDSPNNVGDDPQGVEREAVTGISNSTACDFALSKDEFFVLFKSQCSGSIVSDRDLGRYFKALQSLKKSNIQKIEKEFIVLKTWPIRIKTLTAEDTACTSNLLCKGVL